MWLDFLFNFSSQPAQLQMVVGIRGALEMIQKSHLPIQSCQVAQHIIHCFEELELKHHIFLFCVIDSHQSSALTG